MTTSKAVPTLLFVLLALAISVVSYVRAVSPTHTVTLNAEGVADELRTLNDLVRTRYVMQDIVTLNSGRQDSGPELAMVNGAVVAGNDLAGLRADDVTLRGQIVRVRLPAPRIVEAAVDASRTKVWDPKISFWADKTGLDPAFESEVAQKGTKQIRDAAIGAGILKSATATAERAIQRVLTAAGFKEVEFWGAAAPEEAPPSIPRSSRKD